MADFNGDGKADLVISGGYQISIRLGNGDGSFGNATTINLPASAFGIAVADFNGDGKRDLALGGGATVSVLLGNGNGTFAAASSITAGSGPYAIVAGDLNHDGKSDLATANYGSNNISVLLGNGNGTFAAAVSYAAGTNPKALAAADLNGDGTIDLAVANEGGGYGISTVSILIGATNGTFGTATNFDIGAASYDVTSVTTGDFNGDGKTDLAFALDGYTAEATVLTGHGDGTFNAATIALYDDAQAVLAADFDRDGYSDLAVAGWGASTNIAGHLSIVMARHDGSFVTAPEIGGQQAAGVVVADFNGDGIPDLGIAKSSGLTSGEVMLGNGDGTFRDPLTGVVVGSGDSPARMAVGDFNGDGKQDLAITVDDSSLNQFASILIGNGDGTFNGQVLQYYTGGTVGGPMTVADVNGDGKLDLIVLNANNIGVLLNTGQTSRFASAATYGAGTSPTYAAIGDFNGDGKLDLAVTNGGSNNISILFGTASGTFGSPVNYAVGSKPNSVVATDLNRDGSLDLVVTNAGSNSVSVLLGNGAGIFATPVNYAVGDTPGSAVAVDINGDSVTDIAFLNGGANSVSLLLGNGDGSLTLGTPQAYEVSLSPFSLATGDFNRDGTADLIVDNGLRLNLSILLNSCTPPPAPPTGLVATGQSNALVNVVWNPVTSATTYQVERKSSCCAFVVVATVSTTSYDDTAVVPNVAFQYRVRAVNAGGSSGSSNTDLATTVRFTDDPVDTTVMIKAVHLTELRTAVNAVRLLAGLPPASFTDSISAGILIKGVHMTELRDSLDSALYYLTLPYGGYTDSTLVGLPVKGIHLQEIRNRMK